MSIDASAAAAFVALSNLYVTGLRCSYYNNDSSWIAIRMLTASWHLVVSFLSSQFIHIGFKLCLFAVLFIYDALIMLDRETACFWTTPLAGAPLLFFANKCISIVVFGGELVEFAYFPSDKVSIIHCSYIHLQRL